MDTTVIAQALAETARKRRLLSPGAAGRLGSLCADHGISDLDGLRSWLESGDGLSAHLASQLIEAVAPRDLPAFDRWLAITHLADGGMGSVYLAASPDNELVVIKTLRQSLSAQLDPAQMEDCIKRFEREAAITQHLVHPHVVRCLGAGACGDGTLFMALEFVDSGDLKELVEGRAGLGEGLALAIAYQVVEALDAATKLNLVHRDLKPANIFVSSRGQAKLADFGIARSTESDRTMLTMEGALVGSPHYMAPEQALAASDLDGRVDIYAMGCVLYFSLAAAPPYSGSLQDILHAHCTAVVPDIRHLRPAVSEATHRIIACCMAKERERRFANPAELRDALAHALVRLGLTPGQIEESTRPCDLSDGAGFAPDQPTVTADLGAAQTVASTDSVDETIAADFSAGTGAGLAAESVDPTAATLASDFSADMTGATLIAPQDMMTMVADLMQGEDTEDGRSTLVDGADQQAAEPAIDGNLDDALEAEHVALVAPGAGDAVLLWAKPELLLGKLREAPIDCCLRNYPVQQQLDACMRISRRHLVVRLDALEARVALCDQGSPNGTDLDGIRMAPQESFWLDDGVEHLVLLAGVLSLRMRTVGRSGEVCAGDPAMAVCGLECPHPYDAVLLTRPANRPELAYAMVLRRLSIGGPGADLVLAGARSRSAIEVARYRRRWLARGVGETAWRPLSAGSTWDCGGIRLCAEVGDYRHID